MNNFTHFLETLTTLPGVYSMYDASGQVIYVGKAKNLKKRVSSYFHRKLDTKTLELVKKIHSIQVTVTRNEREALLLESNLIKEWQPRYNIIFRDDKSYPYLYFSLSDAFPRLSFCRGREAESQDTLDTSEDRSKDLESSLTPSGSVRPFRKREGRYFGPYPSSRLAREALNFLQRMFKLRQCDNAFFKARTRPCLQYQIKRCTAPCVGHIDREQYRQDVQSALLFLEGKSQQVIQKLALEMEQASAGREYEKAAQYRDQITLLRGVQEQQIIFGQQEDLDILGIAVNGGLACIHVLMVREGRMMGTRQYFPAPSMWVEDEETSREQTLLEAFIMQHYCLHDNSQDLPREILVSVDLEQGPTLEELLRAKAGHRVTLQIAKRGLKVQWLDMATLSAKAALKGRLQQKTDLSLRFEALQEALDLASIPQQLVCFDVSHTSGEATVASCVVFDLNGPLKTAYRRFNIRGVTPGDDYGALKQALTRHFTRLKSEGKLLPDVVFIDGGKGQLAVAEQVLEELQVTGVFLIGIAKGPGRKAGLETLYLSTQFGAERSAQQIETQILPGSVSLSGEPREFPESSDFLEPAGSVRSADSPASVLRVATAPYALTLPQDSPALHLIQAIRDEAHRFAISGHRSQRAKRGLRSSLENIPGIGKQRRVELLRRFGGLQEIRNASVEELAKTSGVSQALALRIYQALHGDLE